MAQKDRDLVQLANFQKAGIAFGDQIVSSAGNIVRAVENAESILKDRVGTSSMRKAAEVAEELKKLGTLVSDEMSEYYMKTLQEQEEFDEL